MHRRAIRMGATALVCAVALTACSAKPSEQQSHRTPLPEPSLGQVAVLTSAEDITLPMDAYTQTPEQRALDYEAYDVLVARCMRKSGVDWRGDADERARQYSNLIKATNAARFGLVDERIAAEYGYHQPPDLTLSASQTKTGQSPSAECATEAKVQLGKDAPPPNDFSLSFHLDDDARAQVKNDSRYVALAKAWSACMARAGYHYATPEAAADDGWPTGKPSTKELTTAGADVTCKLQTNYLGITVALTRAYQEALMEQNAEVLHRLKLYYEERSRQVLSIVNGS
jgi:hypothetical protein